MLPLLHRLALLLLVGLIGLPSTSQANHRSVDAGTSRRFGLAKNRQVKNASLESEKYADKLAALRTRQLPEFKFAVTGSQLLTPLSFSFEKGAFGVYPGIGPIPGTATEITTPRRPTALVNGQINQPLTQLHRIRLNLQQLHLAQEIAAQQVQQQRQTITNQVKKSYYAILQTQSAMRAAAEAIKLYQELDRVTGEYVVQQVALKHDSLEVQTRLEKAKYDSSVLSDQLATMKEQLNQLLGRDINTDFSVSPAPAYSPYETDLAAAHSRALAARPEIKEAQLKRKQAEYDRRIKRAENIPDISLSLNYFSFTNTQFLPKNALSFGVVVSWEPFDWGRKKREVQEKDRTIEQADNALRDLEAQVLLDVNSKFRKLQQTRQLLTLGKMGEETAQEKLRVMTNRYTLQAALLGDVLTAQTTLAEARNQYLQALLGYWSAQADFEKAIGGQQ
ncbi:MAG: TolC family protein [Blastocatellia bacterium]